MTVALVSLDDIHAARERIAPFVKASPLVAMTPSGLVLKAESLHPTGAFKLRGAFNALLSLSADEKRRGVVAHSAGNHAQALAYAAGLLGIKATLVIPKTSSPLKIEATRRWGATVVLVDPMGDARFAECDRIVRQDGAIPIPPYDSLAIMAGTGTIGLEILKQMPEVECVVAPVAGGGLLGGLAAALVQSKPGIKVIGTEPALADDAMQSIRAGRIVEISQQNAQRTIADGLRTTRLGALTWPHIHAFVHDIIPVSEDQTRAAMKAVFLEARLVAEPSAAVAVAGAPISGADPRRTIAVLSGGNIDPASFHRLLAA